jgi:hypothetical protein
MEYRRAATTDAAAAVASSVPPALPPALPALLTWRASLACLTSPAVRGSRAGWH